MSYPDCVLADRNRSVIQTVVVQDVISQHKKEDTKGTLNNFTKDILAEKKEGREAGQNFKPKTKEKINLHSRQIHGKVEIIFFIT